MASHTWPPSPQKEIHSVMYFNYEICKGQYVNSQTVT